MKHWFNLRQILLYSILNSQNFNKTKFIEMQNAFVLSWDIFLHEH